MNKTLLLLGASGGLGNELIPVLHKAGYKLALHYHNSKDSIDAVLEKNNIRDAKLYKADITSESDIETLINAVNTDFNGLDVVVNNAGVSSSSMSWKYDMNDWDKTVAINLTGPFMVIKHALNVMRPNNFGRIINITSIVAQTGFIGTSAYAASKAGLIGMTKSVSKEVANKNITVNNIALGYFNAGMIHEVPDNMQEDLLNKIPKKAFGKPEELAECILYLANENNTYLTGQTINLNGGLYS